jgi:hypothetical protein
MIGVRKFQVLVDLCIGCQGLFFEKGRLEALIERLRGGDLEAKGLEAGDDPTAQPSLLQQLAAFLEDTEPDALSVSREASGVLETVTSAFSSGLSGSRRVLYDIMVMLGDIQKPGAGRPRKPGGER